MKKDDWIAYIQFLLLRIHLIFIMFKWLQSVFADAYHDSFWLNIVYELRSGHFYSKLELISKGLLFLKLLSLID